MRHGILLLFLWVAAIFPASAQAAAPQLSIQNNQVIAAQDGKRIPIPENIMMPSPVENSDLRFATVDPDDGKAFGLAGGLYLFTSAGEAKSFVPVDNLEACATVIMSPGGTVLAVDSGTYVVRNWFFFSYPDLKPMSAADLTYYQADEKPPLLWKGDGEVFFTSVDEEGTKRVCDYDPCGPTSVMRKNLTNGKATPVLPGNDLCNYELISFSGNTLTAEKLCLPDIKAWKKDTTGLPRTTVTVTVP